MLLYRLPDGSGVNSPWFGCEMCLMPLPSANIVSNGCPQCGDVLGGFHHPLKGFSISDGAVPIPHCDAVCQYALNGAPIEVH